MSKFKKGDRVQMTEASGDSNAGDIRVITQDDSHIPYVSFLDGSRAGCIDERQAELHTGGIALPVVFKAGDIVRMKSFCSGSKEGEEYTLRAGDLNGDWPEKLHTRPTPTMDGCTCHDNWELVTPSGETTQPTPTTFHVGQKVKCISHDDRWVATGGLVIGGTYTVSKVRSGLEPREIEIEEANNTFTLNADCFAAVTPYFNRTLEAIQAGAFNNSCAYIHIDASKPPLLNHKNIFKSMKNYIKDALMSAEDKALIKAGYLNSDLTLSGEGERALQFISFEANKKALVAMAEAKIAEDKANS